MRVGPWFAIAIGLAAISTGAQAADDQVITATDATSLLNYAKNDVQNRYFSDAEKELDMASSAPNKTKRDAAEIASIRKLIERDTEYASTHGGMLPPS